MSSSKTDRLELQALLDYVRKMGFDPIGIIFYDGKTKLLGLAPMERVPEQFVTQIGNRLGAIPDKPWMTIGKS